MMLVIVVILFLLPIVYNDTVGRPQKSCPLL